MSNYFKHKMRKKNPATIAAWIILGAAAFTGLAILFGFIIMWLWNWLMPEIFGLTTITYWQAIGLFILSKIIFGGFGGKSHSGKHAKYKGDHSKCHGEKSGKNDFSKWKHYDKFWTEEGDAAYQKYILEQDGASEENETENTEDNTK